MKHTTQSPQLEFPFVKLCECGCGQPAPIATHTSNNKGVIKGQPQRFVRGHNSIPRPLEERFWEKVNKRGPNECWLWIGSRNSDGYGQLMVGSKKDGTKRCVLASRVAYELTHGPIQPGMLACHHCDNPPCCNPNHLFEGTYADNLADMYRKGRDRNIPSGKALTSIKLTEENVRDIRRRFALGTSRKALAEAFGVSRSNIYRVVSRKSWKHVT